MQHHLDRGSDIARFVDLTLFFCMDGSSNDINVMRCSPVFNLLMEGKAPPVTYEINGDEYDKSYYFADGIYPGCATLVKTFRNPNMKKNKEVYQDARSHLERCGAGIWCAPSSVGNCSSPS
jgi:hypothetical protein